MEPVGDHLHCVLGKVADLLLHSLKHRNEHAALAFGIIKDSIYVFYFFVLKHNNNLPFYCNWNKQLEN